MSTASPSAPRCAKHPESPAVDTCERCGNFMCTACSEGGTSSLCPACRALTGAGTFPLTRATTSFDSVWNYAWDIFAKQWVLLSVAPLLFFVAIFAASFGITIVSSLIQVATGLQKNLAVTVITTLVVQVVQFVVQGIVELGLYQIFLDVLEGKRVDLARFISQAHKLGWYLLQTLLIFLLIGIPVLIYGVLVVALATVAGAMRGFQDLGSLASRHGPSDALFAIIGAAAVVAIVPYIYFFLPLLFARLELVKQERVDIVRSISNCYAIARGHRLLMFAFVLLSIPIAIAGMLACCIGILPAFALIQLLMASLFLGLRNGAEGIASEPSKLPST